MLGMNAETGKPIEGLEQLRQSVRDILSTPIGSRVMRRDYGSNLFELLDRPVNRELLADIQAAVVMALSAQEPRIRLSKVKVKTAAVGGQSGLARGRVLIDIEGYHSIDGEQLVLENLAF
ncbi:phage baseplate protein [Exilibacterium tricleocarpae]|uniref:Phage baseplate protein n=1 Tax=Exilibacterium tricleocarpae TaxID=2591008 RepID=A0A545T5T8_9GAMM|nr:GPW/gp25 family protein [Exilibacterium tricleocarpae]TQV72584.1 phage baseplate protein [Exilibacterium tricleocarpae]